MRRARSLTIVATVFGAVLTSVLVSAAPLATYRISFPPLKLREHEAIDGLDVSITCARFVGILRIPADWYVATKRGDTGESQSLTAGAGHGVTRLPHLSTLDGSIRIEVDDLACFNISAIVTVAGDDERQLVFSKSQLRLRQ
jgi:hypothetical protein